jgi:NAD(P)-dependent dehydrogenase (short-subunit alcohol dehydrogenase family)
MDLGGRTALLTSATGGLGRAIATVLAARGARLILSSRKTEESPVRMTRELLPRWQHREHPTRLAMGWCARSSATSRRSAWRHFVSERSRASQ